MSIRIPRSVFIRETASAPFASTDFAMSTMLVTFGVSFTIRGFSVTSFTAFVTAPATLQSVPKAAPPCFTLGQDMLSSIMSTAVPLSFSASSAHSSIVEPAMLAIILVSFVTRFGSS